MARPASSATTPVNDFTPALEAPRPAKLRRHQPVRGLRFRSPCRHQRVAPHSQVTVVPRDGSRARRLPLAGLSARRKCTASRLPRPRPGRAEPLAPPEVTRRCRTGAAEHRRLGRATGRRPGAAARHLLHHGEAFASAPTRRESRSGASGRDAAAGREVPTTGGENLTFTGSLEGGAGATYGGPQAGAPTGCFLAAPPIRHQGRPCLATQRLAGERSQASRTAYRLFTKTTSAAELHRGRRLQKASLARCDARWRCG